MNQIDYLANNTFRHQLFTLLERQYTKICPQKIKAKHNYTLPTNRTSPNNNKLPNLSLDKTKKRSETIDVPLRIEKTQVEETHSQGQRVITTNVMVINTFNQILSVQRQAYRMQKIQLLKYLENFYSNCIVEQINKLLQIPETLTLQMYEQIVFQIQQLDRQRYLNFCFQLYDIQGQGVITSSNLVNLLAVENNNRIEQDLIKMINYKRNVLLQQLDGNDIQTIKQKQTIIVHHKKSIKGKRLMISQIDDYSNQLIVNPINRLKLIDKQQFLKIWNEQLPVIGIDLFEHLNDIQL